MIPDRNLTDNFTLYELTGTEHADLLELNRQVTPEQIDTLTSVAKLAEQVRTLLGVPLKTTSGYRCPQLNAREGSTNRSQHLLCQAIDFVPLGIEIGFAFRTIWKAVRAGDLKVGQLIFETANRSYGVVSWVHVSLGSPWRPPERCNQILRMEHGVYTFLTEPPPPVIS
jgi:hypothetical protein